MLERPYRDDEMGPPLAHRLSAEAVADLARQAGFAGVVTAPLGHMALFLMVV